MTELKQHLELIKKNWQLILIFVLLLICLTAILSYNWPIKYDVSESLIVTRSSIQQTSDYQYDGYYSIKATDEFSNSIKEWLKSPEIVISIYKKAKIDPNFNSFNQMRNVFEANKMAPQHIEVNFSTKNVDEAKKISEVMDDVLQEKANLVSEISWQGISFSIVGGDPVIIKNKQDIFLNSLIALAAGLVLAIFIVYVKEYFE